MRTEDNRIVAIRVEDSRNVGWLRASVGDVLTADGWSCSSDRPDQCGSGLYGWQIHPVPTTPQQQGWDATRVTSAAWVAWESMDPDKTASLWGKVATYQARIVRAACDPIEMLAWVRSQGYIAPSQLVTAAERCARVRWGWMARLGVVVLHDARYRTAVGERGWPITREDYRDSSAARGYDLPSEWEHTFAEALATGAWDNDGKRVPGYYDRDVQQALADSVTVDAAFHGRMVREWSKLVRKHEIARIIAEQATHAGAYEAIRSLYLSREAARLGRAPAVDVSAEPDVERRLRTAERGNGARSDRRSVAVWYRGEIVGWVTPYRAGAFRAPDHVTTVGALRAKAKRVPTPPNRYGVNKGGTEAQIVERARKVIGRRGWSIERYQRTSGGWGRSADYGMRVVDRVHGVTIASWAYGVAPSIEAAIVILDTDRAMRGGKKA